MIDHGNQPAIVGVAWDARAQRATSGCVGLAAVLLGAMNASAQSATPAATAGFPTEPVTTAPASSPEEPPGTAPPEVPPPPPPSVPAAPAEPAQPAPARVEQDAPSKPFEPSPPPARSRRGPIVALRAGYAIPMGKLADMDDAELANAFSSQLWLMGEIGWRPIPMLLIGGYVGMSVGGAAGDAKDNCAANDASCVSLVGRLGVDLQYHFLPDAQTDPWLGYGMGFEAAKLTHDTSEREASRTFTGFELAHFMAGVDFRVSQRFGLGPFLDFALGRYTHISQEYGNESGGARIKDQAGHQWFTIGARGVFYP